MCGCPVVCSNRSAMPEIAGKGAILADPTDPISLSDSLKSVLENPVTVATLASLGRENAKQFSWENTANQYQELFARMLSCR